MLRRDAPRQRDSFTGSEGVLAAVADLFFVARIRETARLTGVSVEFARTPEQVEAAVARGPRFALLDLTAGWDYERVLQALAGVPVLGFTTHALARQTQPWHERCARVVTKETLTQELPRLLREGVGA
ncbi:MAG: hypothetical protein A3E31_17155 [Candidatus Rokubacteria bacterium RIFCSPHIGHO2_12_FULL_73_22]|nr:MAG: hypothetical protein A3D33_09545 [Candidatus Rokubacteria bacterium RIFCSPHIGHO2_02_FULL_73_26]OGL02229.1 MAG: hypothetical protein A3E31_17155 [Candidatus Rokubacteria bacterium RIFCSPHIGHO2_12_FULL_73_22]OGL10112.1 MAG: hypothetical protein A3I14_13115 [Candidatus Rokubacteria bacterium RIFCSPLOWO2_02_FULL_73_56]OGL28065.1 MAG: hypothetical protein A3G44_11135 [Candidatus Rokubacteria bacterium RIFCSPLOWO2_12_FULL_73_47]